MYTYKIIKLPKHTSDIEVIIPWPDIQVEYKTAFAHLQNDLSVEGFRKGKVPEKIAEKHILKESVYQHLVRSLLSKIYEEIVKKENLKPIISPKVELKKAKESEDWELTIKVAEKPSVALGDYKERIQALKKDHKKEDIWVPGKDKKVDEKKQEEQKQHLLNEIFSSLLKYAICDISELVIEEELNARLAKIVDDVQKIGITTEAYLKSKNMTMEDLKKKHAQEISDTYKIEFILGEIAEKEQIKVEKEDLDKLFTNISDEKERAQAQQNAYFYASVLRKQKTLDFLSSL